MTDTALQTETDAPGSAEDALLARREHRDRQLRLLGLIAFFVAIGVWAGLSVILLILVIVISVFLHELGHYWAAKKSGMAVTEFFIGFGPRIWSFRRGDTEYGVKAIWAGAYVKIVGMNNLEDVGGVQELRTFRHQSYPRRLVTAFAGPGMNLLVAFVLLFGLVSVWGIPQGEAWPRVEVAESSAADRAGLRSGDEILSIDGVPPGDFAEFAEDVAAMPGEEITVEVVREGEAIAIPVALGSRILGISGSDWPEVETHPDSPGALAGLGPGDVILEVDGDPAPGDFEEFADLVLAAQGSGLPVVVERDGARYQTTLAVPQGTEVAGFLGVGRYYPDPRTANPAEATVLAGRQLGEMGGLSLAGLYRFFSPSGLSGFADRVVSTPVEEAEPPPVVETDTGSQLPVLPPMMIEEEEDDRVLSILGVVALGSQLGAPDTVLLLAFLNVFLALFNLIPLLPFDGGHMAVATYERLREGLARRGLVGAKLDGGRYLADFGKLLPLTYAVVALMVTIGLGALWLDAIDPPSISN